MKPVRFSIYFILLFGLLGCIPNYTNTQPRYMSDNELVELDIKNPVAIKNTNTSKDKIRWCTDFGNSYYGNLFDYTESAIGIVKNVFERQGVIIDDASDKTLELSVDTAKCSLGSVTTTLHVKTGSGIEKKYEGRRTGLISGYQYTRALESTMVKSVQQMLNDKEIIEYLQY